MNISNLKSQYKDKKILKSDFIDQVFEIHKTLFNYVEQLKDIDISNINIDDGGITFISKKNGVKIFVDHPDKRIAPIEVINFGEYEGLESRILYSLIESDAVIFDIGANIGWHSLSMAKENSSAKIYAFEPIKQIYDSLIRNIEINCANIKAFNLGFSDSVKNAEFYYDNEYCSRSSTANLSEENVATKSCQLTTIDRFIESRNINNLDLIKCDVEGHELFVYKGAIKSIRRFKPIIFSEMLRKWAAKFDYHPNDIIDLLGSEGYDCYSISDIGLKKFGRMNQDSIETNFVFLHHDYHKNKLKDKIIAH